MVDQLPCPVCRLGGGFHDKDYHHFGISEASALWGSPLRPALERGGYEPYVFVAGQDEYVLIWKKGFYAVPRGWETPEKPVQGDQSLQPKRR